MLAQQEQQLAWAGKLRSVAEPAAPPVECAGEFLDGRLEHAGPGHDGVAGTTADGPQAFNDGRGRLQHLVGFLAPHPRDLLENFDKARPPPPRGRWEIGPSVKRFERGGEPHAHRPAPGPGGGLNKCHVDAVHIWPLLAINLDRHVVPIEQAGHVGVFETLMLHHVAPVARRIADRQENQLVFTASRLERGIAPRVPVDWVVLVLEKIRTLLCGEAVWHL